MARPSVERLTAAFRDAVAGLTQEQIGEIVGVHQTTVSKWLTGKTQPPLEYLPAVEEHLGLQRGRLLRQAGFVDDDTDLETAIETAPAPIDPTDRQALLLLYRTFAVRHMANGSVMPSPRTPGMTRAEERLDAAAEEQRRRNAPPAAS